MSDKLYRLFLTLLPKFRVEPERKGRCLGELVRRNVSKSFPKGGQTTLADVKLCECRPGLFPKAGLAIPARDPRLEDS